MFFVLEGGASELFIGLILAEGFLSWLLNGAKKILIKHNVSNYAKHMRQQIEKVLEEIRPMLALHRGNVEFVNFENGVVYVRMLGTCQGCPLSQLTLKAGIEDLLKSKVKGIDRVEAV